jgi:hypothetical protein
VVAARQWATPVIEWLRTRDWRRVAEAATFLGSLIALSNGHILLGAALFFAFIAVLGSPREAS